MGQRLENLLVLPAGLAGLFVEVERRVAIGVEGRFQVDQQSVLMLVRRSKAPGPGDFRWRVDFGRLPCWSSARILV